MPTPVLPSLSRAPSFKTKRTLEDGTVSDKMESGYVATRPRFTRLRRTFAVSYENLVAEDLRALDLFETQTVKGMAGAFYLPNLLPNGSFEFAARAGISELVQDWVATPGTGWTVSTTSSSSDGLAAVEFFTVPGLTPESTPAVATLQSSRKVPVAVGDQYQASAEVLLGTSFPAASVVLSLIAVVSYADGSTQTVTVPLMSTANVGVLLPTGEALPFSSQSADFTIPASGVAAAVAMTLSLQAAIASGTADAGESGSAPSKALIIVDQVSVALISPTQPYGRMPGSSPTGTQVRLSKTISAMDKGWLGVSKAYDVSFEVTEV